MAETVYPVPGVFLPGYPTVERTGLTKQEAAELVATGAYQRDKPEEAKPEPDQSKEEE